MLLKATKSYYFNRSHNKEYHSIFSTTFIHLFPTQLQSLFPYIDQSCSLNICWLKLWVQRHYRYSVCSISLHATGSLLIVSIAPSPRLVCSGNNSPRYTWCHALCCRQMWRSCLSRLQHSTCQATCASQRGVLRSHILKRSAT